MELTIVIILFTLALIFLILLARGVYDLIKDPSSKNIDTAIWLLCAIGILTNMVLDGVVGINILRDISYVNIFIGTCMLLRGIYIIHTDKEKRGIWDIAVYILIPIGIMITFITF